jgi:hypothetical protein
MALADLQDIRAHLAEDKLVVDAANTGQFQVEVTRIIKSYLSGVFQATTLASWVDPDTTPEIIRAIAGELIAAFLYRKRYAEDDTHVPEFAQTLYNEAIGMLREIRDGTLIVLDEDDNPIEENQLNMDANDFYPNDSAPGPFFGMELQL